MRIGAHVHDGDPVAAAAERGAEVVQIFLSDPQAWESPKPHPQAEQLLDGRLGVFVHSPYRINVASVNNRIRIPSRKLVTEYAQGAATVGAQGLVVHGGHVAAGEDPAVGIDNWRKFLSRQADAGGFAVPILIENTAGGENAVARRFDALARLWEALSAYRGPVSLGFCFDTCHAHAAGEELGDAVDRVRAITGSIDLLHANDSRDPAGTGADRHANLGAGELDPETLRAMIAAADAPVVIETPGPPTRLIEDLAFVRAALASLDP